MSKQLSKVMVERRQDNALVVIPSSENMSMHAPTQGLPQDQSEVWIPEKAIKGSDALTDFSAFALLRLPKNRIQNHLINEQDADKTEVK
ncbi:hypothetical protein [Paenibacillus chitinolyticus]|uniref:hypothetical protein n=1 Tax=Paenibacillus chitinolyticus TaxID=79263 RepID=UPI00295E251A|nr:hypothetical protein [Paenibacillus chitinolyticus]